MRRRIASLALLLVLPAWGCEGSSVTAGTSPTVAPSATAPAVTVEVGDAQWRQSDVSIERIADVAVGPEVIASGGTTSGRAVVALWDRAAGDPL